MRGKKHSLETKEKVRALCTSGFSVKEVHDFTGVSENTIYDWLNGDFLTDDEFKKVRDENKKRIINKSWDAVLSAIDVMKSKIERALRAEEAASSIIDKLLKGKDLDEAELKKQIPANRFGEPEEVAAVVGFLCTKEAAYVTGQTISVNGGLYT